MKVSGRKTTKCTFITIHQRWQLTDMCSNVTKIKKYLCLYHLFTIDTIGSFFFLFVLFFFVVEPFYPAGTFHLTVSLWSACNVWNNHLEIIFFLSSSDTCEKRTVIKKTVFTPSFTKHREGTAEQTVKLDLIRGSKKQDTEPFSTKSCVVNPSKGQVSKGASALPCLCYSYKVSRNK